MAPPAPLAFTDLATLITWMDDDGLTQVHLADVAPRPGPRLPRVVRFTWWQHDPGARRPYRVTARGVTAWSLDGELGDGELSIAPPTGAERAPIELVMHAPGRLVLACASLQVRRGRPVPVVAPARPATAYAYLTLDGVGVPTAAALVRALTDAPTATLGGAAPTAAPLPSGRHALQHGDRVLARVVYVAARADGWLSIARADATDDEWRRCQAAPRWLASTLVGSAWDFVGSAAAWLALVGAPPQSSS